MMGTTIAAMYFFWKGCDCDGVFAGVEVEVDVECGELELVEV